MSIRKVALALAGATVMLAALAGSASARNLSASNRNFRATWREMTFTEHTFNTTVRCPVTLEGSLHAATIAKVAYTLIGWITKGIVGPSAQCAGGEATILQESLPWNVRYQGFEARLPEIRKIFVLIAGASFRIHSNSLGATCLFTTRETTAEHGRGTFNRNTTTGELTSVEVGGEITSNEGCALGARISGSLSGTSNSLTLLGTTTKITVTLI